MKTPERAKKQFRRYLFKSFWYGFLHPWKGQKELLAYAERSFKKLESECDSVAHIEEGTKNAKI